MLIADNKTKRGALAFCLAIINDATEVQYDETEYDIAKMRR